MKTIWFCGSDEKTLTTIAEFVGEELINRNKSVELIVESEIREILGRGLKDTPEDKSTFTDRLGFLGNLLHRNNIFALIVSKDASLDDRELVKKKIWGFYSGRDTPRRVSTNKLRSSNGYIIRQSTRSKRKCKENN